MSKGSDTRQAILEAAVDLAAVAGLGGVTIGSLARATGLSKSGLFGHFGSKEALQVATLEAAADRFVTVVIGPALACPAGTARVRALFDRWQTWSSERSARGGCLFVAASIELDDRNGPARRLLVEKQRAWLDTIARCVRRAIEVGDFAPETDPDQFAHDFYAIALGYHHARRLLRDPEAEGRSRFAFDRLIDAAAAVQPPVVT